LFGSADPIFIFVNAGEVFRPMVKFATYTDRFRLFWTPFLRKRGGKMWQAVGLACPPTLGAGGQLTIRIGQQKHTACMFDRIRYATNATTQDDDTVYLWLIPRPGKPVRCQATWKTAQGAVHRASLMLKPAEPTTSHVIFKTHIDLGYTHRAAEVVRLYQTRFMEDLLSRLDKTADRKPGKGFVWTLSTWLMERCLDSKGVKPALLKRFEQYIRAGRVVWGLMPFTTHSEFFGLEEMCRSIYAARRLAERFDQPVPRAAKMTDVPAHTASLAMAFAAAGGTFFQIGTNPESKPPVVPPLFWWKLPDGKRMLTHYHSAYGTPLLPPEDWPYRHWLSTQITGDNIGPQNLEVLDHIAWIDEHFDYPICKTGRLENFGDAVIREHGQKLPTIEKEFTDWWIYGIASQADITALARCDKERLPSIETLQTMNALLAGKSPNSQEQVRQAYEQLALYTEHTWGDHATDARAALPKGNRYTSQAFANEAKMPAPPAPVDRWVASWKDKADYVHQADRTIGKLESAAFLSFAARCGKRSELGIALFNTLSWPRGGLVRLEAKGLPAGDFELIDPTTGGSVLYERKGNRIEFLAPQVPACGYLVLRIQPVSTRRTLGLSTEWYAPHNTLHSSDYSLQFHKAGGMARWHDRARSHQWCSGEVDHPMGTYLYEMPGGDKLRDFARQVHSNAYNHTAGFFHRHDYDGMSQFGPVGGSKAKIKADLSPLRARVTVEAACPARRVPNRRSGDARRVRTTFTTYRGCRNLYVNVKLFGKRPTYAAEAGYAFFPFFGGDDALVFIDRIAHIARPKEEFGEGINLAHMAVHRGVRIEATHVGMNFYPLHTPLLSFDRPGAYGYDENADDFTGTVYATLFNNCWGTNFAQWQSGDYSFDFVCRPTGNDDWDGGLARDGAEVHRPLMATVVPFPNNWPARSVLRIEPKVVQLVTLKPAEFDTGTIIRLWNADVEPVKAKLTLPETRQGDILQVCDLVERPTRKRIAVSDSGDATVPLKANEVVTLQLRPSVRRKQ